jgi:hypothetical protein
MPCYLKWWMQSSPSQKSNIMDTSGNGCESLRSLKDSLFVQNLPVYNHLKAHHSTHPESVQSKA